MVGLVNHLVSEQLASINVVNCVTGIVCAGDGWFGISSAGAPIDKIGMVAPRF